MGILPLQFKDGEGADSLGLDGKERLTLDLSSAADATNKQIEVTAVTADGKEVKFTAGSRLDTEPELAYFLNGGILNYVLRKLLKSEE